MKIYCSCCDKVQPVRIDNCRDAKTNEPFQDIVCAECDLVIAAGTDIAQQQEPVAWMHIMDNTEGHKANKPYVLFTKSKRNPFGVAGRDYSKSYPVTKQPLYTRPQAREPLTDEEIMTYRHMIDWTAEWSYINFARAIEAAHGIKGNA